MSQYYLLVNIFDTTTSPLQLVVARGDGDTEQLSKHKELTTELSNKMAME